MSRPRPTHEQLVQRFSEKHRTSPSGCWEWTGTHNAAKYGVFKWHSKATLAHRVSWLIHRGEIGDLIVCHRCDNPPCVNPEHLFLGTYRDNVVDMHSKGRWRYPVVFSEDQKGEVRALYRTGKYSQRDLGRMFDTHQANIWRALQETA